MIFANDINSFSQSVSTTIASTPSSSGDSQEDHRVGIGGGGVAVGR